jgi:hypothetical protein
MLHRALGTISFETGIVATNLLETQWDRRPDTQDLSRPILFLHDAEPG